MEAKAIAKDIRISADKARLVINLIRGKNVAEATGILNNLNKKASHIILKVLNSAVSNAQNNLELAPEKLYIKAAYVNEGQVMKKIKIDSRGRTGRKDRRFSHITVVVSQKQ